MKQLSAILTLVLFLCSCTNREQEVIGDRIISWSEKVASFSLADVSSDYLDSLQIGTIHSLQDSLNTLDVQEMSRKNRAYYELLSVTLSMYLTGGANTPYIDDSLISESEKRLLRSDDYYGCRASLFHNIIKMNNNNRDTTVLSGFCKVLDIYNENSLNDTQLIASINRYIGEAYKMRRDWDSALNYHNKALAYYRECNDSLGIILSYSVISRISSINGRDSDRAGEIMKMFESMNISNKALQNYIYFLLSSHYYQKGNYLKVVDYTRKRKELNDPLFERDNKYYHKLSSTYYLAQMRDSALHYAKLSVMEVVEEDDTDSWYSHLAKIYYDLGEYELAASNYKKSLELSRENSMKSISLRIERIKNLKLEKEVEIEKREVMMTKVESERKIKTVIFIAILTILCFVAISNYLRWREKKKSSDMQIKNMELSQQILRLTMSSLPKFMGEMNAIANRSSKYSKELCDDINTSINGLKANYRNNISSIVNSELFVRQSPFLKHVTDLTDQEKIIFFFYEKGYSAHDIAEVLGTTPENVRATKSRIKSKMAMGKKGSNDCL